MRINEAIMINAYIIPSLASALKSEKVCTFQKQVFLQLENGGDGAVHPLLTLGGYEDESESLH